MQTIAKMYANKSVQNVNIPHDQKLNAVFTKKLNI